MNTTETYSPPAPGSTASVATAAYLPHNGELVRVVEIAPWDTVPHHTIGEVVNAIVIEDGEMGGCLRCDANCNGKPDTGDWLLLVSRGPSLDARPLRTLCRVVPA